MSTTVIISTDTGWDYTLLAPINALLWRDMVEYDVFALTVGDEAKWADDPIASICLRAYDHHGISHEFVPHVEGFRSSNCAQIARQHAAASPRFSGDDWIMPLDADMWPLQRDAYHQHEGRSERLVHYYGNGDCFISKEDVLRGWDAGDLNFQSIPSFYFTMRAETWRELYAYPVADVGASLWHTLDTVLHPRMEASKDPTTVAWYFDQYYATERVCRQDWFPKEALLIQRPGGGGRGHMHPWDQGGGWEGGLDFSWLDVHMRKGTYAQRRWEPLLPIVDKLIPQHTAWAREYFEAAHEAWKKAERIP